MLLLRKIYFRADASSTIGYGHFIRTLALADMLKDDFDCTFFTCHPTPYQMSEMENVCPHVALQEETHYDDFLSHLRGDEIVVLDNYFFDTYYQCAIKQKGCCLVCIDDMHDKHYVADVVINHGVSDAALFDTERYTRLCLGFDWVLLRKPFMKAINKPTYKNNNLIVFGFGASDPLRLSIAVADIIEHLSIKINAIGIIGDGVKKFIDFNKYRNVKFVSNLTAEEMASLFYEAKYAILPASGMCLEAIACRCKLIVGYFVDNQKYFSDYLAQKGFTYNLGNMADEYFLERLMVLFNNLGDFLPEPFMLNVGIEERYIQLLKSLC